MHYLLSVMQPVDGGPVHRTGNQTQPSSQQASLLQSMDSGCSQRRERCGPMSILLALHWYADMRRIALQVRTAQPTNWIPSMLWSKQARELGVRDEGYRSGGQEHGHH